MLVGRQLNGNAGGKMGQDATEKGAFSHNALALPPLQNFL